MGVKCLSLQSEHVLTELSCHSYLEGSAAAAAAAGLAPPIIGLIVSIATNVQSLVLNGNQNKFLLSIMSIYYTHIITVLTRMREGYNLIL